MFGLTSGEPLFLTLTVNIQRFQTHILIQIQPFVFFGRLFGNLCCSCHCFFLIILFKDLDFYTLLQIDGCQVGSFNRFLLYSSITVFHFHPTFITLVLSIHTHIHNALSPPHLSSWPPLYSSLGFFLKNQSVRVLYVFSFFPPG